MKKAIIAVVVAVIVIGGGYLIIHKSSKKSSTTTASTTAPAASGAVLTTQSNSSLGQYLADGNGKALYTYGGDSSGVSNCTGPCLATWPAYIDTGSTTNLPTGVSTIKRSDNGVTQYTYNGMPLYYFASDTQGQVTGNGVANFTVAKPASAGSSQSSTPSSSFSNNSSSSSSNSSSGYQY